MSLPRKLKNFVLFNDGNAYIGEVPEVTLPKLTRKMEDYRAGGMNGSVKLDMGMEGLAMEWTAAGFIRTMLNQWGEPTAGGLLLRFAGALQADDVATVVPVEVVVRGRHEEIDFGNAKAGEKTEIKVKTTLSYFKLTMDGQDVIEIDLINMVEVVNGMDRLAQVRAALGI